MKATELIAALQEMIMDHGDAEIIVKGRGWDGESYYTSADSVDFWTAYKTGPIGYPNQIFIGE